MARRTGSEASDRVKQQLSDWMDNELPEEERPLLWARILQDEELAARWERYHLIGDVVRNRLSPTPATDVADRVGHRLGSEAGSAPRRRRFPGIGALAGGAAVASLVGLVAVAAMQVPGMPGRALLTGSSQASVERTETLPRTPTVGPTVVERSAPEVPSLNQNLDPRTRRRLQNYLADHNAELAESGRAGNLPYLRMTDSETARER